MASGPITSWQIEGEQLEAVMYFIFLGSKITANGDFVHAQSLQSRLTICDPVDCSPPGSPVHGILQTRILEWVAMSFSRVIFLTQGLNLGLLYCRQILY